MASSKRERELARQRAARQAARRAERDRRRKRRNAVVAGVIVLGLLLAAGASTVVATRDDGPDTLASEPTPSASASAEPTASSDPSASPTASASAAPAGEGCTYTPGREAAKQVSVPGPDVDRSTAYRAVLETSQGQIVFDLRTADAPCTVHSFRSLAAQDFFDDTPCHRLTDQGIFVLQCGDPSGTGRGGPGYTFADENLEGATYERGTVAMANSGENTNGSQFFLVYQDSQLPPQYTPFGRLTEESLAVLDKVAAAGAAPASETGNTAPNTPVQISDFRIEPA